MYRAICAIILIVLAPLRIYPQTFTASVNNTTVGIDDRFELSFTYSGDDINQLKNFRAPDFNDFIVLSGPNYSTSMQIINGAVSASQTQTYIIKARAVGKFTIGSATIEHSGNIYKSTPLVLTVIKGTTSKSQPETQEVNTAEIAENIFVKAIPDKNRVYKGEQVIVTFKLYSRLSFTNIFYSKVSQQEGFWTEEIETDPKGAPSIEMIDGKKFQVYILNRIAVFPSRTGELVITPNEFKIPVIIQRKKKGGNSLFDDFFNDPFFNRNESYEYTTKSNRVVITALPLPESSVPESFNGVVGDYSISSELSKTTTKANEPISLKLQISGSGNIALINIPELKLAPGFETYEPKSSDNINRSGRISGGKTIDYLIIPRTTGKKEIPPVEFSYFSPLKKSYVTLRTPAYTINVEEGESNGKYFSGKEEIRILSDDIRYIKTSGDDIKPHNEILLDKPGFWIAIIFPVFLFTGAVWWRKKNDKLYANLDLLRYQKAEKVAKTRYRNAKRYLERKEQVLFYSEIAQALFGYLEDKLHIPKAEFSLERAAAEMSARNISEEIVIKMKDCAEKCEFYRFAPHKDGTEEMNIMYSEMTGVIIGIEKSLLKGKNGK